MTEGRIDPPADFSPSVPRRSATLLILRGASAEPPLEVFMQRRHETMDFPGVYAFPGGGMSASDMAPELVGLADGVSGLPPEDAGLLIAGIRETYEECGFLFARAPGEQRLVGPDRLDGLTEKRAALGQRTLSFVDFLRSENLRLAGDLVIPFTRWLTPWWARKRFDTHFYIALEPEGQVPFHDGKEAVESIWFQPSAPAIAEGRAGKRLIPPTEHNLQKLRKAVSLETLFAAARRNGFQPVNPWLQRREGGFALQFEVTPGDNQPPSLSIAALRNLGIGPELARAIDATDTVKTADG